MVTIVQKFKRVDQEDLYLYISMIEDLYDKAFISDYKNLAEVISNEFDVDCMEQDIREYYAPSIKQDEEDLRLQYKNLGYE